MGLWGVLAWAALLVGGALSISALMGRMPTRVSSPGLVPAGLGAPAAPWAAARAAARAAALVPGAGVAAVPGPVLIPSVPLDSIVVPTADARTWGSDPGSAPTGTRVGAEAGLGA